MARKVVSGKLVREVEGVPFVLNDMLAEDDISDYNAIFVVGRLIREGALTADYRNKEFEGFWRQACGLDVSGDFLRRIPEVGVAAHVSHLESIVKKLETDDDFEGVLRRVSDCKIFEVAQRLGVEFEFLGSDEDLDNGPVNVDEGISVSDWLRNDGDW